MNVLICVLLYLCIFEFCAFVLLFLKKSSYIKTQNKKTIKIIDSINNLINEIELNDNKYFKWLNSKSLVLLCLLMLVILCWCFQNFFNDIILTFLFVLPFSFFPIFVIYFLNGYYKEMLEKNIINYIVQLKNQAQLTDDIFVVFKNVLPYTRKPLKQHVSNFLLEFERGIPMNKCFYNLKKKVSFYRFKDLLDNIENCCVNGGNLYKLLDKTQNIFMKYQNERIKRKEQTMSARIILSILIVIVVYIYISFIKNNDEIYNIMINDFFGTAILYFNVISIWIMLWLIFFVKKFDN